MISAFKNALNIYICRLVNDKKFTNVVTIVVTKLLLYFINLLPTTTNINNGLVA